MKLKRVLVSIIISVVLILLVKKYLDVKTNQVAPTSNGSNVGQNVKANSSEIFPIVPGAKNDNIAIQKDQQQFAVVLKQMTNCLSLHQKVNDMAPMTYESLMGLISLELGTPELTDRWSIWRLKNNQGEERRIRLISADTNGAPEQELSYYKLDNEGIPERIEIAGKRKIMNPSNEDIHQLLASGEIFYSEYAKSGLFTNGETLNFVEINGLLTEFEIQHDNKIFICHSLEVPGNSCSCVN